MGFVSFERLGRVWFGRRSSGATWLDEGANPHGGVVKLAAVSDRATVTAQNHGPPASWATRLAPDGRGAHFGAGLPDRLHGSHRNWSDALAAR